MNRFFSIKGWCVLIPLLFSGMAQGGDIRIECSNIHLKKNIELHGDCLDAGDQLRWGVWIDLRLYIANDNGFLTWERHGGFDTSCSGFRLERGLYLSAKCEAFRNGHWTKVRSEIELGRRIKVQDGWLMYEDFLPPTGPSCTHTDYKYDETGSYPAHSCQTSCECNSTRTCSGAGHCQSPRSVPSIVYPNSPKLPPSGETAPSSPRSPIIYGSDPMEKVKLQPLPEKEPKVPKGVPRGSSGNPQEEIVVDRVDGLLMENIAREHCIPSISMVISYKGDKYLARVRNLMLIKGAGGGQRTTRCFFDLEDQHTKPIELSRQRDPSDYGCWIFRGFKSRREFLRIQDRTKGGARCALRDSELRDVLYGGHRYNGHYNARLPYLPKMPRDVDSGELFEVAGFDYIESGEPRGKGYLGYYNQRVVVSFVEFVSRNQLEPFKRFMSDRNWHHIPTLRGYRRNYNQRVVIGGELVEKPYMYVTNMKVSLRDYLNYKEKGL